ncbi:hypothetical protein COO60DRAFT_1677280 [Scenedesmus sp. NREL 46B-D3]|nr:hypothetical protein COO60DRAFT_1677280 [Scenedesmus sp. NREL 46B-D3]
MDGNGQCNPCTPGNFCPGGDAKVNPTNQESSCPSGLVTTFAGAKSQAQCFTQAGYGRVSTRGSNGKVTLSGVLCEVATYNVGSNTAGCQKCGAGLTTAGTGSTAASACLAPAGSNLDKGIGKLCQRGTYSTDLSSNNNCVPCPEGITTANEGSTTAAACSLALKGYYIDPSNSTLAIQCPLDTYQDQEAAVTACTPCPFGWKTKETGATGLALCLAPPGFELLGNAASISACPAGSYKADWNRNLCVECGSGVITAAEGSVSKDACLVPAGWGLTSLSPMVAEPCQQDTYGHDVDRVAVANARCTACPTDMFTLDTLEGRARNESELYTSEAACLVKPGWGTTSTIPQECPVGTFNEGNNRAPCQQCGTGWTTVAAARTSEDQCVVQAGWQMAVDGIPAPCDKGTFSTGGTELAPNATCTACDNGYSTQEDESTAVEECAVCAAGYGGSGCAQCPYGFFAYGGAKEGIACAACAAGSTSRKGATHVQQCYSTLIDARNDVFNLVDEAAWSDDNATTGDSCGTACTDSAACVMYKFVLDAAGDGSGQCSLLSEAGTPTHTVGFKIGNGDDYSVWGLTQSVGAALAPMPAAAGAADTEAKCKDACTAASECEVYVWQSGSSACSLTKSELEEAAISMFQVSGAKLYSDLHA